MANLSTPRGSRRENDPLREEGAAKTSTHAADLHHLEQQLQTDMVAQHEGGNGSDGQIRMENAWLRRRVLELEQQLVAGSTEDIWLERQKEYEALLEEKSEVIRMLHHKIHEMQEVGAPPASGSNGKQQTAPRDDELIALKQQLEEERQQLREDEESLMAQMRQMELMMSKERAELARQRTELQRMHEELNREVEMAARDGSLRDRLSALQRRHQEAIRKPGPAPAGAPQPRTGSVPPDQPTPLPGPSSDRPKSSGLLRRIFG